MSTKLIVSYKCPGDTRWSDDWPAPRGEAWRRYKALKKRKCQPRVAEYVVPTLRGNRRRRRR